MRLDLDPSTHIGRLTNACNFSPNGTDTLFWSPRCWHTNVCIYSHRLTLFLSLSHTHNDNNTNNENRFKNELKRAVCGGDRRITRDFQPGVLGAAQIRRETTPAMQKRTDAQKLPSALHYRRIYALSSSLLPLPRSTPTNNKHKREPLMLEPRGSSAAPQESLRTGEQLEGGACPASPSHCSRLGWA